MENMRRLGAFSWGRLDVIAEAEAFDGDPTVLKLVSLRVANNIELLIILHSFSPVLATMEGITIPSDIPEDLKKACDSLVKRANEVKRTEPVIAYWCKLSSL